MLTFTKAIEEINKSIELLDYPDIVLDDDNLPSDVAVPVERTIWLIRHASTEMNAHNGQGDRIRGWRDVPLSEQGYVEADKLADKLRDSGIDLLVYSDFSRSRATADAVARTTGAETIACSDFRPWNVGNFTGRNSNDAHPELVQFIEDSDDPLPGGESFDCFRSRVFDGLRHLFARFPDRNIGIVTHHRVERLIQAWIKAGMSPTLDIDIDTMVEVGEAPASAEEVTIDVASLGSPCNPQEQKPLGVDKNLTLGDVHQPTSLKTISQSSGRLVKPKRSLRDKIAELKASGKVPMSDDDEQEKEHATGGISVNESTSQQLSWPSPADHQWAHDGNMEMPRSHQSENAALGTREKVVKDDEIEWRVPFDVIKADADNMWVFGWASIVEADGRLIEDKQGDIIPPDELEKAAYDFVLYSRSQGDMHEKKGVGRLIESMVFTLEKQETLGVRLGLQGWWVGFKVDDPQLWSEIKSGTKPEFSIGGKGVRTPV